MSEIKGRGPAYPMTMCNESVGDMFGMVGEVLPPNTTAIYGGLTERQYAAIELRVPDSGDEWLDDMIRAAQRDHFAAKAMQGYIIAARLNGWAEPNDYQAKQAAANAYMVADAMLAAREGKS